MKLSSGYETIVTLDLSQYLAHNMFLSRIIYLPFVIFINTFVLFKMFYALIINVVWYYFRRKSL